MQELVSRFLNPVGQDWQLADVKPDIPVSEVHSKGLKRLNLVSSFLGRLRSSWHSGTATINARLLELSHNHTERNGL
jgi:hypothetical protein